MLRSFYWEYQWQSPTLRNRSLLVCSLPLACCLYCHTHFSVSLSVLHPHYCRSATTLTASHPFFAFPSFLLSFLLSPFSRTVHPRFLLCSVMECQTEIQPRLCSLGSKCSYQLPNTNEHRDPIRKQGANDAPILIIVHYSPHIIQALSSCISLRLHLP